MQRKIHVALVSIGLLLGTAGCTSFLTGDKLSSDPNLPSAATAQQLFVAVQSGQFAFQEGTGALMMCGGGQACGAANGGFVQEAGEYVFDGTAHIGPDARGRLS